MLNAFALRRHKHAALLALLLAAIAIQSFDARPGAEGTLSDALRSGLGIAILVVVFERPRERAGAATIFGLTLAIGWGRHVSAASLNYPLSLAIRALTALFLWAAVWVILHDLFRKPPVGAENVLGAICGYLIAADAWAGINAIAYLLTPAGIQHQFGGQRVARRLARPDGAVFLLQLRANVDDRLRGRDAGTRTGDDVESARSVVRTVLYRHRGVAVRRFGAIRPTRDAG